MDKVNKYKITVSVIGFVGTFLMCYSLGYMFLNGGNFMLLITEFLSGAVLYAWAIAIYPEYRKLEDETKEKKEVNG